MIKLKSFCYLALAMGLSFIIVWHECNITQWHRDLGMSFYQIHNKNFFAPLNAQSENIESSLEAEGESLFLWAYGPAVEITFHSLTPTELTLCFSADNPIEGQHLTLMINGKNLDLTGTTHLPQRIAIERPVCRSFQSIAGMNSIRFNFDRWNHKGSEFAPGDPRPKALRFTSLRLERARAPEGQG